MNKSLFVGGDNGTEKSLTKLSYTLPEAVQITGVCRTLLYREISEGRLRAVKVGRATRLLHDDICDWLKSLPRSGSNHAA